MNMVQALNSAMDVMLARDPDVLIFGEDVGFFGGVFRVTDGLQKKHGRERVFDTPIAEGGMLAIAVGMGTYGLRPIVEIQFADYIYPATDQLISEAARLRYRSAGEFTAPITVRAPVTSVSIRCRRTMPAPVRSYRPMATRCERSTGWLAAASCSTANSVNRPSASTW